MNSLLGHANGVAWDFGQGELPVFDNDAREPHQDEDGPPYRWSDLLARRNALGLQTEEIASILKIDLAKYHSRESGRLRVGRWLMDELFLMEEFVDHQVARYLETVVDPAGIMILEVVEGQDAFVAEFPDAHTRRDEVPYPVSLQYVAAGTAAAELSRRGHAVEVHRGDRRADLTARRCAAGLLKNETAALLGIQEKRYYRFESGTTAPGPGLIAELQAVDDFIVAAAQQLDTIEHDGTTVVLMVDDRQQIEQRYPQARTLRDGVAYPGRVHRVAAARRARQFPHEAVRIAVAAD